jgi:hypothetical protein
VFLLAFGSCFFGFRPTRDVFCDVSAIAQGGRFGSGFSAVRGHSLVGTALNICCRDVCMKLEGACFRVRFSSVRWPINLLSGLFLLQ